MSAARNFAVAVLAGLSVAACGEGDTDTRSIDISGTVVVPDGNAEPTIHLAAFHAWSLEGELRHPLQRIADWEMTGTDISHRIDYPDWMGTGLAVYAWQDLDGDGVHCTPAARDELAGLTVVDEPGDSVNVEVVLTRACAGPDWFYPN